MKKKTFSYMKINNILVWILILAASLTSGYAQITITKVDATCKKSDGTATASVNHGLPPYKFKWSNGSTGATATNLAKGTYTVTVTDSAGCTGKKSVTIKNRSGSLPVSISGGGTVPFCVQDGPPSITITASVTDGTPPYTWFPSQSLTVSGSGTYSIGVVDDNYCTGRAKTVFTYVPIRCSRDPNEILGPEGFGSRKFISSRNTIPYIINFENDPEFATAPAQRVEVRHTFDPHINMYSLRLTDFGFRGMIFNVPPNSSSYSTRLDVRDSLGIYVDVTAGLDISTQTAFWIFQSIDPATGFPPNNPDIGFLPVNDSLTHHGEGYVSFSVKPRNNTQTGDSLKAAAVIVFDINPPLATNTWVNTADAFPPVSHVNVLPGSVYDNIVELSFTSADDAGGSGVKTIHIYAAEGTLDFIHVGESHPDSTFMFNGNGCTLYQFFSIAEDQTGNTEAMKTLAETATTLNPPPSILDQSQDTSVNEGDEISLHVITEGAIQYYWEFSTDGGFSFNPLTEGPDYTGTATSILTIHNASSSINGNQYRCVASNGSCFTLSDPVNILIRASLSGLVQYDNALLSPLSNTEVYLENLSGEKTDSTLSNQSGSYLFDLIDPGTYTYHITPLKDWGGVNATDALKVLRHFAQLETLSGLRFIAADVNNNQVINSVDGLLIARRFVAISNSFVTGDWYSESDTLEIGTAQISRNIRAICYGDADGSYIPGLKTEPGLSLVTEGELAFRKGSILQIPFSLNRDVNAGAMSVQLAYPSDQLEIENIIMTGNAREDELLFTDRNGILRMAWYSLNPIYLEGGNVLFTLMARVKDRPVSQNLDFYLDGSSEISNSKAIPETDLKLIMPKLKDEQNPDDFILNQNYPNPFAGQTEISFYLPKDAHVVLKVFDAMGKEIKVLLDAVQIRGWHKLIFDGSGLASGTYPLKIDIQTATEQTSRFRIMTKTE